MASVGVIVPVYRVEPYLRRCVDSILTQSCRDLRLVLVDDGSPDNSGAICDAYAAKDSRVTVIHQENGGLSAARNEGICWFLENSDCQWLTFVDSDDWIHSRMLEWLLDAVNGDTVKISACGYTETDGETPAEPVWSDFVLREPEDFYVPYNINAVIACGKLYHRDCFRDIRFPVGKLHEDEFTTYQLLFAQKQIAVSSMPLYYYFRNTTGITKSGWTPRRMDVIDAFREQIRYFHENGFDRAYEAAAVEYTGILCRQKKHIQESDLEEAEKKRYLNQLDDQLKDAVTRYGCFYFRRRNLDIFCELIPGVAPAFQFAQKVRRLCLRKGGVQ